MWYAIRERVKWRSIPLPLYLKQQALRLTVKMVKCSRLNEKSLGQSSGVTWRGGGIEKVGWLVHMLFAPKRTARVREIWRRILVWIKPALEADHWGQPAPGKLLTRKKESKKSENWEPIKDKYNSTVFLLQFLNIGKLYVFKKRKKL